MKTGLAVRQAAIAGTGEADRTTTPGRTALDLAVEAAREAIADAGLDRDAVDAVYTGYSLIEPELDMASRVAQELGIHPTLSQMISVGGATGAALVQQAAMAVGVGAADTVLVVWADNRSSGATQGSYLSTISDQLNVEYEVPYGPFVSTQYALIAQRYQSTFGATPADLAEVSVAFRKHAALNPKARYRDPLTVEDVLESPMVTSPLRRYDCCIVSDFGGAVIVTSADRARGLVPDSVEILGYGQGHTHEHLTQSKDLMVSGAATSGRVAFEMSGLRPHEIDMTQIYDCFTITVLIELEDLGFCGKGEGADYIREYVGRSQRRPSNTNGGMLSCANGGILHVTEAVRQMQGRAGAHQLVRRPSTSLVHGNGGMMSSHVSLVLGAA